MQIWRMEAHEEGRRRMEVRATCELDPRIFGWCVSARAISDGFEASTKV